MSDVVVCMTLDTEGVSCVMQPDTRQSAGKALARALECFQTGIQRTPENVYAAHGVGAVLAEQGHTKTAQTIFTLVGAQELLTVCGLY